MDEYITKEQVIEWFRSYGHTDEGIPYYGLAADIRGMKAADVAPVIRGCWTRYSTTMMSCSVCGRHTARHKFKYCPHCGARMNGGDDDDT